MDFLKNVLSDDLFKQLKEALKDNKDIKIGNLASGEYVSADKYNSSAESEKQIKQQLAERDEQLKGLQNLSGDNESLNKQIADMQNKNKETQANYENKLYETNKNYALDNYLKDNKAKNFKSVKALLDNETIIYKDNKFTGLEEQVNKLKENEGYLFDQKSEPMPVVGSGGAPPINNNQQGLNSTKFDFNFTPIHKKKE